MSKQYIDNSRNDRKKKPSSTPPPSTRITIEQKISGDKKGIDFIKRSFDPKAVVIQRRFGEGSKPLFAREDVHVNTVSSGSSILQKQRSRKERSSSNSSSEHARQKFRANRQGKSQSPKRKKSPEKLPYFIDPRREEDRLRAKYKNLQRIYRSRSRSRSRRRTRTRSRSTSRTSSRRRGRSRRRYRSRSHTRSRTRSRRRHRSYSRHRSRSRDRYRSSSKDKSKRRSLHQEQRYIPVAIPVEYPCPTGWIGPQIVPQYPRNPFLLRPPLPSPSPFYPLRQPFVHMQYPRGLMRFPGYHIRPNRHGPR